MKINNKKFKLLLVKTYQRQLQDWSARVLDATKRATKTCQRQNWSHWRAWVSHAQQARQLRVGETPERGAAERHAKKAWLWLVYVSLIALIKLVAGLS